MKRAFTLMEMMVVIGMIMILLGAMTASVARARTRARIAKAAQETSEMTNAILGYENYAKDRTLSAKVTGGAWQPCTESSMAMILGGETSEGGEEIPVLFNASIKAGQILDPWGNHYEYMIEKTEDLSEPVESMKTAAALPNYNRLTDEERRR